MSAPAGREAAPRTVLLDIEGTVAPVGFVHDVLFPYARTALDAFLSRRGDEDAVRDVLGRVPGPDKRRTLLDWMDEDRKVEPLKTLQGLVWEEGYGSGALRGELYPDVAPVLRRWHGAGLRLAVYSSGSEAAQRLIFGHSTDGDLAPLFEAFFDTRVGAKRESASYRRIATSLGEAAWPILFLSDIEAELDAAEAAGLATCQLVRPEDGTEPSGRHRAVPDLPSVAARFGLPAAP